MIDESKWTNLAHPQDRLTAWRALCMAQVLMNHHVHSTLKLAEAVNSEAKLHFVLARSVPQAVWMVSHRVLGLSGPKSLDSWFRRKVDDCIKFGFPAPALAGLSGALPDSRIALPVRWATPAIPVYAGSQRRWRASGSAMPPTAPSPTERSAAVASAPDAVEYPERHWIAQSVAHGYAVRLATVALDQRFRNREDVLVAMELVVYYQRGDNTAWLRPDVLVAFGVQRGVQRSTFKVWEEGTAPDFVLEVASPSTAENDARHKAPEYARIGVREYWRLDPEGTLMGVPLEGYRACGGRYSRVASVVGPGGVEYLRSGVLGLDLRTARRQGATVLVIRDPRTGEEFDDAVQEYDRRRRIAEDRASVAVSQMTAARDELSATRDELTAARDELSAKENRVRELEQQLRDATGQTRPMGRDS